MLTTTAAKRPHEFAVPEPKLKPIGSSLLPPQSTAPWNTVVEDTWRFKVSLHGDGIMIQLLKDGRVIGAIFTELASIVFITFSKGTGFQLGTSTGRCFTISIPRTTDLIKHALENLEYALRKSDHFWKRSTIYLQNTDSWHILYWPNIEGLKLDVSENRILLNLKSDKNHGIALSGCKDSAATLSTFVALVELCAESQTISGQQPLPDGSAKRPRVEKQ